MKSWITLVMAVTAVIAALPRNAAAQQPRAYAGGSFSVLTQTHSDDQPLGGTTIGGSVWFGVGVSSRVSIEFEPTFVESYSSEYSYRPSPSLVATVEASRRDTFFPVQARLGLGVLEPVVGGGVVHSEIARHATFANGTSYFDDGRSENDLALIAGLDAALKLASRVDLVPTFRVLVVPRAGHSGEDPLGEQTSTGWLTFRYGIGARMRF